MKNKDFTIDLMEGIKDPTKAKAVAKQVQDAYDDVVIGYNEMKAAAEKANSVAGEFEEQAKTLLDGNLKMTEAMKNIHTILGSKKDLWRDDKEMKVVMDSLAQWVMGSGAIKMGIISNKMEKNNEE